MTVVLRGPRRKVVRLADSKQQSPHSGGVPERGSTAQDLDPSQRRIEVSAGAGAVRARVDGRGRLRDLTIEPAAFAGRDAELLSDLVLGAVAEAQRQADALLAGGGEAR